MVDLDCNCPHTIPIISHSMHHRIWILLAAYLTTCSPAWAQTAKESRPNVILVVTDDQGYGDCGFTGNKVVHKACDWKTFMSIRFAHPLEPR